MAVMKERAKSEIKEIFSEDKWARICRLTDSYTVSVCKNDSKKRIREIMH